MTLTKKLPFPYPENLFLTKRLGWKLERSKDMPVHEGGTEFYTYYRYNKAGEQIDEYIGGDASVLKADDKYGIPFYQDWNFLMQAIEEIQTNEIIQEFASINDINDEYGNSVFVNIFGHFHYNYYWNITDKKFNGLRLIESSKKDATFKAVIDIFKFCEKFL